MVAAQVIGNDVTITIAGQSGNFQLNVMLPVVALNLIQSIELLASASRVLADSAIAGFKVNQSRLDEALERNPILVTALNPVIGYEKGAAIAKQAYKEGRAIKEVAERGDELGRREAREAPRSARAHEGRDQRRWLGRGRLSTRPTIDAIRRRLAAPRAPHDPRERIVANIAGVVTPELRAALERPARRRVRAGARWSSRPDGLTVLVHRARRASQGSRGPDQLPGRADRRVGRDGGRRGAARSAARRSASSPATSTCSARSTSCSRVPASRSRPSSATSQAARSSRRRTPTEVASVFEVPLEFILDARNIDVDVPRTARHALPHLRGATTAATGSGARRPRFSSPSGT